MSKRISKNPKNPREAYRYALECGRKADRAAADEMRYAQAGYEKFGREFLERIGPAYTLDRRGRVHKEGEYYSWSNGVEELIWLSVAAGKEGWTGGELADFAQSCWAMFGHEPAAGVREAIRKLAESGQYLADIELMGKLGGAAAFIAQEAQEADLAGE